MTATQYLQAGQLDEAIQAVTAEVRSKPTDTRARTFLFELLCFAGEYDRATRQLNMLSQGDPAAEHGLLLYRSALAAERVRQHLFSAGEYPAAMEPAKRPGTLNGRPFETIEDADPRIGPRLEVFIAGEYLLFPLAYCASIRIQAPRQLRDLIWATALVDVDPAYRTRDFGQLLMPVLYPLTWQYPATAVRLGRATEWKPNATGLEVPFGQKMFVLDGEEPVSLLEVREIFFDTAASAGSPGSSA